MIFAIHIWISVLIIYISQITKKYSTAMCYLVGFPDPLFQWENMTLTLITLFPTSSPPYVASYQSLTIFSGQETEKQGNTSKAFVSPTVSWIVLLDCRFYQRGRIFRGERPVLWNPTVSDNYPQVLVSTSYLRLEQSLKTKIRGKQNLKT